MHGVINFLKPPGMTSHDAVQMVRRATGIKRVGHAGTLDPAAAGVLLICVGAATRLAEYLQNHPKEYIAESTFGYETDTLDAVGEILFRQENFAPHDTDIQSALPYFTGNLQQIPPHYSALKKEGRKLYELARKGQLPPLQPRAVCVHELELTHFTPASSISPARAMLRIKCGSGTYIRSLIRDIGHHLGGYATMTFLVRTQNGGFTIDDASTAAEIITKPAACLFSVPKVLSTRFNTVIRDDAHAIRLSQGQWVEADWQAERVAVITVNNSLAVIAKRVDNAENTSKYKPEKVMDLQ